MKKKKTTRPAVTSNPPTTRPVTTPAASSTDGFKAFILLVASVFLMLIFFGLEPNKFWFNERILTYWEDFKEQKLNLDIEERKMNRYQGDYLFAKNVTDFFKKKGIADKVLVLVPPANYFKANGLEIHVPEPAVFYYFTGLKTIWPNSPEAAKANWYVTASNGQLAIDSVVSKPALTETITTFNKFKTAL